MDAHCRPGDYGVNRTVCSRLSLAEACQMPTELGFADYSKSGDSPSKPPNKPSISAAAMPSSSTT